MKSSVFIMVNSVSFGKNLTGVIETVVGRCKIFQVAGDAVRFPQLSSTCHNCGEFTQGTNEIPFSLVCEQGKISGINSDTQLLSLTL